MSEPLPSLESLLVCAVCHGDLRFDGAAGGAVECGGCGRSYVRAGRVYRMIPEPVPDETVRRRWRAWETLQENGSRAYAAAPEFNLCLDERSDAVAFREFCGASRLVLDVGCGPQRRPSYLPPEAVAVGVDPLLGQQPRGLSFVQAIGEYLPFRDRCFDRVLYATSLDHLLDPRRSLAEGRRCLRPDGRIDIWLDTDGPPEVAPASTARFLAALARRGWRSLARHDWLGRLGARRTAAYVAAVARMRRPAEASDCFHLERLGAGSLTPLLQDLALTVTRSQRLPGGAGVFLEVQPC